MQVHSHGYWTPAVIDRVDKTGRIETVRYITEGKGQPYTFIEQFPSTPGESLDTINIIGHRLSKPVKWSDAIIGHNGAVETYKQDLRSKIYFQRGISADELFISLPKDVSTPRHMEDFARSSLNEITQTRERLQQPASIAFPKYNKIFRPYELIAERPFFQQFTYGSPNYYRVVGGGFAAAFTGLSILDVRNSAREDGKEVGQPYAFRRQTTRAYGRFIGGLFGGAAAGAYLGCGPQALVTGPGYPWTCIGGTALGGIGGAIFGDGFAATIYDNSETVLKPKTRPISVLIPTIGVF
jgi:hypothetical protein